MIHVADAILKLEAEIQEREEAIAAAMELLAVDPRVQMAFTDGIAEERARVLKLIEVQQEMLIRGGISHAILVALRRAVEEPSTHATDRH